VGREHGKLQTSITYVGVLSRLDKAQSGGGYWVRPVILLAHGGSCEMQIIEKANVFVGFKCWECPPFIMFASLKPIYRYLVSISGCVEREQLRGPSIKSKNLPLVAGSGDKGKAFGEIEAPLGMQSARSSTSVCTINRRKDRPLPLPLYPGSLWSSCSPPCCCYQICCYSRWGAEGLTMQADQVWEPTTVASD
jgi:hypothetical protein